MNHEHFLQSARQVITTEATEVARLVEHLDMDFARSVEAILQSRGRVIVCGMGKSGIIGKKIAATMASTGTPSFFMHPGEAYHGDLGMVTPDDVFIAISHSGETDEVVKLIPFLQDNGNYLIALTGNPASTLARAAHSHLNTGVTREACPLQLAPTSSTTATLVLGDALAVTLMEARNFQPENFARFHPGGSLGRKLLTRVEQVMKQDNLPFVDSQTGMKDIIHTMSEGRCGLAIVVNAQNFLVGIITDGDLRRAMDKRQEDFFRLSAQDIMTREPKTVAPQTRLVDAEALMISRKINSLLVAQDLRVSGIIQLYDL
ncbi:KpsF/GutQ family sugar-phosphate isomerase [Desulfurispirillum indicum]|uniref:KpsF/GutQ family protein n=1 Tax=Desulfurispirillum indicum (strain ATCC BAA-1389 / DSM 22839 / S5) TaxID=653733 RepID=E6W5Z8_DESIS|nr:KpsF/GutQ family sugar-phosphate isomerase [Desulfurispirillum indicum]ADU64937.1 KpsF/GutQ family protein [Desulfurispirillum indicum S5]UCZ56873.1 KpsF/GutQ family sugar-phosphate isomerase [Desulfurispirillum indicum]